MEFIRVLFRSDGVPRLHSARTDQARKSAEVQIGPIHPLHGHAEWPLRQALCVQLDRFKMVKQYRAIIPGGVIAPECNIFALQTGNGDGQEVLETAAFRIGKASGWDKGCK